MIILTLMIYFVFFTQTCQVCRKGDNDDCLLLCDSCDRGCHMYCLRPKITQVPEGDWFCPACIAEVRAHPHESSQKKQLGCL